VVDGDDPELPPGDVDDVHETVLSELWARGSGAGMLRPYGWFM
jgi:hypothetical protein